MLNGERVDKIMSMTDEEIANAILELCKIDVKIRRLKARRESLEKKLAQEKENVIP